MVWFVHLFLFGIVIPTINNELEEWTCFVDDTFALIDPNKIPNVLQRLNSYNPKIQFTYEEEKNGTIPFLDVLIKRTEENTLETTVYRKKTNNNVYMNWNSYSPLPLPSIKTSIPRIPCIP